MNTKSQRRALFSQHPLSGWSDQRLVRECLQGNEQAWAALIDKYKRLIYSVPFRYGLTQDEASDIFQAVCLDLFSDLSRLRKIDSLPSWLITVASNKCRQWKHRRQSESAQQAAVAEAEGISDEDMPTMLREELIREQKLHEAISRLPERCQEMIHLLFYEHPPLAYKEVAQRLGLATGSIGFIRGRCLKRLQQILEKMEF